MKSEEAELEVLLERVSQSAKSVDRIGRQLGDVSERRDRTRELLAALPVARVQ